MARIQKCNTRELKRIPEDLVDGNTKIELIFIEGSTKHFSASSAWARCSDGLEHDFLLPTKADSQQDMSFGEGGVGTHLSFFFNSTNGQDEAKHTDKWCVTGLLKCSTHIRLKLPPERRESEHCWQ